MLEDVGKWRANAAMNLTAQDSELEIVGFDGSMISDCGSALPIVHSMSKGTYFARASSVAPELSPPEFCEEEYEGFVSAGRITRLPRPIRYRADSLIVFVKKKMSEVLAPGFLRAGYDWQELQGDAFVTCHTRDAAKVLLDSWATTLMIKSEELLKSFIVNNPRVQGDAGSEQVILDATQLAKMAMVIARSTALRQQICIRYGLTIVLSAEPGRLNNIYRFFVAKEHPKWSWEDYKEEIDSLEGRLRRTYEPGNTSESTKPSHHLQPAGKQDDDTSSQAEEALSTYWQFHANVAALSDRLRQSIHVNRDKRIIAAVLAQDFRKGNPLDQAMAIKGLRTIEASKGYISTNREVLTVLGATPLAYYSRALSVSSDRAHLSKPALINALVRTHLRAEPTDMESTLLNTLTRHGTAQKLLLIANRFKARK